MKKRVLLVTDNNLGNTGVPRVIMEIVRRLSDQYVFDLLVAAGKEKPGYYDAEFLSCGGKRFFCQMVSYSENRMRSLLNSRTIYREVKALCAQNQYAAVHSHLGFNSGAVCRAAAEAGVLVRIAHIHGVYTNRLVNFPSWIDKTVNALRIRQYATDRLACSAKAGASVYGNSACTVVLNPVDVQSFSSIRRITHEGTNMLQIGYFSDLKNQKFSIRVLSELVERQADAKLYLIGQQTDSVYEKELWQLIEQLGLDERVILLPHDIDKAEIFPKIDCLLLPSKNEGLGIVALEVQAAGIRTIASTAVPRDVDLGLCVFLPLDDPARWGEQIMRSPSQLCAAMPDKLMKIEVTAFVEFIRQTYASA